MPTTEDGACGVSTTETGNFSTRHKPTITSEFQPRRPVIGWASTEEGLRHGGGITWEDDIKSSESDWAEDTASTNLGYAESVVSHGMSETTALTNPASEHIKPAREVLVDFLLEDAELRPLLTSAALHSNIGMERRARNSRRLLDTYSIELLGSAVNPLQREVAKFVRASPAYVTCAWQVRLDLPSPGIQPER